MPEPRLPLAAPTVMAGFFMAVYRRVPCPGGDLGPDVPRLRLRPPDGVDAARPAAGPAAPSRAKVVGREGEGDRAGVAGARVTRAPVWDEEVEEEGGACWGPEDKKEVEGAALDARGADRGRSEERGGAEHHHEGHGTVVGDGDGGEGHRGEEGGRQAW